MSLKATGLRPRKQGTDAGGDGKDTAAAYREQTVKTWSPHPAPKKTLSVFL